MELEAFQEHWERQKPFPKHHRMSKQKIEKLIKRRVGKTMLKTLWPELIMVLLGGYFVFLTIAFFGLLGSTLLQLLGALFIAIWASFSSFRLLLLTRLFKLNNSMLPPLQIYQKALYNRLKFERVQLWTPALWIIMIVMAGVLSVQIYNEYDVTQSSTFWVVLVGIAVCFSIFYHYRLRPYYSSKINQVQALLEDLLS